MRFFFLVFFCLLSTVMHCQDYDSTGFQYASQINKDSIESYLRVIASDDFEGRETGERGQKLAAEYIASHFKKLGIAGGGDSLDYFQRFHLYAPKLGNSQVVINSIQFTDLVDYYTFTPLCDTVISNTEVVFLGYGITRDGYDNYKGKNVEGKLGIIYRGEPSGNQTEWATDFSLKSKLAKAEGLTGLIVVDEAFERKLPRAKHYMSRNSLSFDKPENSRFPVVHIGNGVLEKMYSNSDLKMIRKGLRIGQDVWTLDGICKGEIRYPEKVKHVIAENVIGWIPGKKNPDEFVFLTAHYDHLGKRGEEIYNGADDDGSGTSALLEIARIFRKAELEEKELGRSVVFLFVSGEEKGLLGSSYYVNHPLFPLNQTVTDLNIDMIGRRDTEHVGDSSKYLYVIGSDMLSHDLFNISENVNEQYCQFDFDYRFDAPDEPMRLYYRSDHYNFAKYGIPVIFYFRGLHEDYHKPTDTVEKIEFQTIVEISQLIYMTAREVGNRPQRLVVKVPED